MATVQQPTSVGAYYTPAAIAEQMVSQTLGALLAPTTPDHWRNSPLRIFEPTCGEGIFLVAAYRYLLNWCCQWYLQHDRAESYPLERHPQGHWQLNQTERQRWLGSLFGMDLDSLAVQRTREALQFLALGQRLDTIVIPSLLQQIQTGNTLQAELPLATFDLVLGNPPFLDSEAMSRQLREWRIFCQGRYTSAIGNWDLFCVFIERALELCKPGGISSLVVPNKLLSAIYAAPVRHLLAVENHLLAIHDYSKVATFTVAVYPIVYICRKASARSQPPPTLSYETYTASCTVVTKNCQGVPYTSLLHPQRPWLLMADKLPFQIIQHLQTYFPRLESLLMIRGAATVAEAYRLAKHLQEWSNLPDGGFKMVNSGTIDPYCHHWNHRPMRYLGKRWLAPAIAVATLAEQLPRRYEQTCQPKLIVAGLAIVPEVVLDLSGELLAGKSTTILLSPGLSADAWYYLLAVLNSRLMGYYYRQVFHGDSLGGGYLRMGPPQLRSLPIVPPTSQPSLLEQKIALAAQQVAALAEKQTTQAGVELKAKIDRWVERHYGLSDAESEFLDDCARKQHP